MDDDDDDEDEKLFIVIIFLAILITTLLLLLALIEEEEEKKKPRWWWWCLSLVLIATTAVDPVFVAVLEDECIQFYNVDNKKFVVVKRAEEKGLHEKKKREKRSFLAKKKSQDKTSADHITSKTVLLTHHYADAWNPQPGRTVRSIFGQVLGYKGHCTEETRT